jgi:hypothetical protein
MTRPIRVTAIYNKEPQIKLYVLALIALARQLQEEEAQSTRAQLPQVESDQPEGSTDA